jgi:hypothetical protein
LQREWLRWGISQWGNQGRVNVECVCRWVGGAGGGRAGK